MHSGEDLGKARTPPRKDKKKRGESKKEEQRVSPQPKARKQTASGAPRGRPREQTRVQTMAERKFNDPEIQSRIAQSVASTQHITSGAQVVNVPLSTIQHGSVVPVHSFSGRDDHSSYHRSISPSSMQGHGGLVLRPGQPQQQRPGQPQQQRPGQPQPPQLGQPQPPRPSQSQLPRPGQQQQPRWVIQGIQTQPRASPPKPAPHQQIVREHGPVMQQGETIVLQRHIAPSNQEGAGMPGEQLYQKINPETQSHEFVFKQYKQAPVSTTASSVQELIEQQNKMVEAGRHGSSMDVLAAHSVDRYSPPPQQVSTIRRTPSPAHMQVGRVSPVGLPAQQRRSPGPSADRTQPVNLSVSEIKATLAAAKVTQNQGGTIYTGGVHRVPSTDDECIPAKDMMRYAHAQGDLLKHALMTGTLPPHVQNTGLSQKTSQREQVSNPHQKEMAGMHSYSRRTPSPSYPGHVDLGRISPHQQRHPSPNQRQPSPHHRYSNPQQPSPPQRQISPNPRQTSPHQRHPSPSHSPGQTGRDSVSPMAATNVAAILRRTPSPKPQHRHKESMAALTNPKPQAPPSTVNIGKTTVPIRQPFVNLVRLQEVTGHSVSVSQHPGSQVSTRPAVQVSGTQRQNPVLQSQLSQGYEPHISPENKIKEQAPVPVSIQPRQRNPFTFPPQIPTSLSQMEPHAFTQYKDPFAQVEQEEKTLPDVAPGKGKKSPSPDDMPRLTPINPIKSENQDPNTEMVQMPAPFSKRLQNIANLPTSSINRSTFRAHSVAVHRAKAGLITSTAKSLDILRQNIQKFINKEIDVIIQDYMEKFFKPGIRNIKINNGENSVNEEHVQAVCRQILEEAKKMYCSDQSYTPTRQEISDTVSESGSTGSRRIISRKRRGSDTDSEKSSLPAPRKKKGRPPLYVSGRSTPSKTVKSNDPVKREGPKWDCDRLTTETFFVMGAKANKALGLGATRGRIYIKHPDIFKYSGDQDDKVWLYENQHMPATGGKTYMLILEDIKDLGKEDDYRDNPSVHVDTLKGFPVPQWMIDKIKIQMAAQRTDTYKSKSRSRSNTPSDIRTEGQEDGVEGSTQKIPFSSFASPKPEDQDPDKDEKSSSADTETEFFSGNDNDNTSTLSPFNMTGGFDDGASPSPSEIENMEDDDEAIS